MWGGGGGGGLRFFVLVPGRPQRIGPVALQKPHQHVAAERIPCGPSDKTHSQAQSHRHRVTAAPQWIVFMLLQDNKPPAGRIRRCFFFFF